MRIERINDNKIKVEISPEDIRLWNIDIKKIAENSPEAQSLFRYALKQAEEEVNFSAGGAKLVVEALPLGEGGFVMFISKLGGEKEFISQLAANAAIRLKGEEKRKAAQKKADSVWLYLFSDFDGLCLGAKHICELFVGDSAVYKCGGGYYLKLRPLDLGCYSAVNGRLSEFSKPIKGGAAMLGYIEEHGTAVIKGDAVETIMNYFG